jgi:hypothetical protein
MRTRHAREVNIRRTCNALFRFVDAHRGRSSNSLASAMGQLWPPFLQPMVVGPGQREEKMRSDANAAGRHGTGRRLLGDSLTVCRIPRPDLRC